MSIPKYALSELNQSLYSIFMLGCQLMINCVYVPDVFSKAYNQHMTVYLSECCRMTLLATSIVEVFMYPD